MKEKVVNGHLCAQTIQFYFFPHCDLVVLCAMHTYLVNFHLPNKTGTEAVEKQTFNSC